MNSNDSLKRECWHVMLARFLTKHVGTAQSHLRRLGEFNVKIQDWQWRGIGGLTSNMEDTPDYSHWSAKELIDRVTTLEQQLKEQTAR